MISMSMPGDIQNKRTAAGCWAAVRCLMLFIQFSINQVQNQCEQSKDCTYSQSPPDKKIA